MAGKFRLVSEQIKRKKNFKQAFTFSVFDIQPTVFCLDSPGSCTDNGGSIVDASPCYQGGLFESGIPNIQIKTTHFKSTN